MDLSVVFGIIFLCLIQFKSLKKMLSICFYPTMKCLFGGVMKLATKFWIYVDCRIPCLVLSLSYICMLCFHIIEYFRLNLNCQYSNVGIKKVCFKNRSTRTIKIAPLSNFRWQNCKEHPN